jgi:hypothetical protein
MWGKSSESMILQLEKNKSTINYIVTHKSNLHWKSPITNQINLYENNGKSRLRNEWIISSALTLNSFRYSEDSW